MSYIFFTHQKSYILNWKISHLTYSSHIKNITPKTLRYPIYILKITFYIRKILHLIFSSHIKNLTYHIRKFLHLISSSHIKNLIVENLTSYIFILHWKNLHFKYLSHIKNLTPKKNLLEILHLTSTLENLTSYTLHEGKYCIIHPISHMVLIGGGVSQG